MGTQDTSNFGKWIFLAGAISLATGFGIFLHASDHREVTQEREIMAITKTNSMPNVAMPIIDRFTPPKTETATFGLG
jgi:hypothetical protein